MMTTEHDSNRDNHNMNNNFDAFLRSNLDGKQPYLDDGNFTASVMLKLPATRKISRWQELLIIFVPLLVVSVLVASQFSPLSVILKLSVWIMVADYVAIFKTALVVLLFVIIAIGSWLGRQFRVL